MVSIGETVTPEQALQIMDQICARAQTDRAGHAKIRECADLLLAFIRENTKSTEDVEQPGKE